MVAPASSPLRAWFARLAAQLLLVLALFVPWRAAHAHDDSHMATLPSAQGGAPQLEAPPWPELPDDYVREQVGDWLVVEFPRGVRSRIEGLLESAPSFRDELSAQFGTPVLQASQGLVRLRIARNFDKMQELAPIGLRVPAYASGVAWPHFRQTLVSLIAPRSFEGVDARETALHELVHIALQDATGGHPIPRWFNEGMAVHLSGERPMERQKVLREAASFGNMLPLTDLERSFPESQSEVNLAYAEAADFVRFLLRQEDHARVVQLFARLRGGQSFESSLGDAYDADLRRLEYQWKTALEKHSAAIPAEAISTIVFALAAIALVVGYARRRRRNAEVLHVWDQEEEAQLARWRAEVERREAEEEAARLAAARGLPGIVANSGGLPRVRHDGDWHTLH